MANSNPTTFALATHGPVTLTPRARPFNIPASAFDLPDEDSPYTPEPWHAVTAVRPDTAHVRALRFLDVAGEVMGALILVIGGVGLTGLASLVGGA